MIFTVYRLELFKMRKRLAAWGTYFCFLALIILTYGGQFYGVQHSVGHAHFGFANALPGILTDGAGIASVFGVVLIVLMVCSEFDWRTSRQNIIDGLSKRQWFTGKALLIPTVVVTLYLIQLAVGATVALLATENSPAQYFDPAATYILAACGVLLAMACNGSIALFIALAVRSTGPALAIALIYQVFDAIAARTLRGLGFDAVADGLPMQVHNALLVYSQYQPHFSGAHSHPDTHWQTAELFLAGITWATAVLYGSYRIYMKRDL